MVTYSNRLSGRHAFAQKFLESDAPPSHDWREKKAMRQVNTGGSHPLSNDREGPAAEGLFSRWSKDKKRGE